MCVDSDDGQYIHGWSKKHDKIGVSRASYYEQTEDFYILESGCPLVP